MKNDLKTEIIKCDNAMRNVHLQVGIYIDDEDALRSEVEDIAQAYNDYVYADWDDMERDCIDAIERHLKISVSPYKDEDRVDNI